MRRQGRADHQTASVADVGEMGEELERVNKLLPGRGTALDPKAEHGSRALGHVFLREGMVGTRGQRGIGDPVDLRMRLKELGNGQGIGRVTVHAHAESFNTLQKEEGIEGREGGPDVAQTFDTRLNDVGDGA